MRIGRARVSAVAYTLMAATASFLAGTNVAHAVSLIHTNDVLSELEPCGCRNNPQGGMARKANFLKSLEDRELIQVDAGDLLFSTLSIPELLKEQSELQAEYVLRAMRELKHDVITPGEKDFALGVKVFDRIRGRGGIPFVSANLKKKNGKLLLESHRVFTRKDASGKPLKVAIFGLSGKDLSWPKELKVDDPITVARAIVPRLRKEADVVVALTHQGLEADQKLAAAVKGIDVIVGAHTQSFLQEPARAGKTWIVQSSFLNQYIGVMPLQRNMDDPTLAPKYKIVSLDAEYDSPAEAPSKIDTMVREFKQAVAELNSRKEASFGPSVAGSITQNPKFQTFPRCASCHTNQFDFWRRTPHAMAFNSLVKQNQAKNKECLTCHTVGLGDKEGVSDVTRLMLAAGADSTEVALPEDEMNSFLKSMHEAKDLKTQVKARAPGSATPEFRPLSQAVASLSRAYTPVQCENCHQPGRDHPFTDGYSKTVDKDLCLTCHTVQRAPSWYEASGQPNWKLIEEKRAKITCPAGDLPPED